MPAEGLARRDPPVSHGRFPVAVGRRRLDLGEHEVDYAVEEIVLDGDVVVKGHCLDAEFVRESAHRQYVKPALIGQGDSLSRPNRGLPIMASNALVPATRDGLAGARPAPTKALTFSASVTSSSAMSTTMADM
jgi:hypothetical protein